MNLKNENKSKNEQSGPISFILTMFGVSLLAMGSAYSFIMGVYAYQIEQEGYNFQFYNAGFGYVMKFIIAVALGLITLLFGWLAFATFTRSKHKKSIKIVTSLLSILSVCLLTPFDSKNKQIEDFASATYDYQKRWTGGSGAYENSIPGKSLKLAIDNKDHEAIKNLVKDFGNYEGLNDNLTFEKLMIVQGIIDQSIRDDFSRIYSDKYITNNEYDQFKKNAMKTLADNLHKPLDNVAKTENKDGVLVSKL